MNDATAQTTIRSGRQRDLIRIGVVLLASVLVLTAVAVLGPTLEPENRMTWAFAAWLCLCAVGAIILKPPAQFQAWTILIAAACFFSLRFLLPAQQSPWLETLGGRQVVSIGVPFLVLIGSFVMSALKRRSQGDS